MALQAVNKSSVLFSKSHASMSDNEVSSSDYASERSDAVSESDVGDNEAHFMFRQDFAPYQGEPLATDGDNMDDDHVDEQDEDGILPSVLEQRFKRQVPVDEWCTCGKCNAEHLVDVREFRCCSEIGAAGKFTFLGLPVDCILNHTDYAALTHRTVLLQAGPLLRNKDGKYYKQRNNSENKFLRAVSYSWLAGWLFGTLGWENTRPLSACIYHNIRSRFFTHEAKGYTSGQERATADCND